MLDQIFIIIIVDEDGPTDQGAEAMYVRLRAQRAETRAQAVFVGLMAMLTGGFPKSLSRVRNTGYSAPLRAAYAIAGFEY